MKEKLSKDGSVHVTDEVINTQTHLLGTVFAILGAVLLIVKSSVMGRPWYIIAFAIYGLSLVGVFTASSLHHGVNASKRIEFILRQIDYFAIFPLIAGTYTPLCLILVRNWLGWSIFGVVWGLAAAGLTLKSVFVNLPKWITNTMYISMGWVGTVIAFPIFPAIGWGGIFFLALGGIFYSGGFLIFYIERPNPLPGKFGFHEIWHILVILGAAAHYLLMYFYVLSV